VDREHLRPDRVPGLWVLTQQAMQCVGACLQDRGHARRHSAHKRSRRVKLIIQVKLAGAE
jgi:hypothetical protein